MAKKHGSKLHKKDAQQGSLLIVVAALAGLTVTAVFAPEKGGPVTLLLYGIFGGAILGTDNVLKFLKAIFRIK